MSFYVWARTTQAKNKRKGGITVGKMFVILSDELEREVRVYLMSIHGLKIHGKISPLFEEAVRHELELKKREGKKKCSTG